MFRAAVPIYLLAACYTPPQPDCGFLCELGGECPEGYTCMDKQCRRNDAPASVMCGPDGGMAPPDWIRNDGFVPDAFDTVAPYLITSAPLDTANDVMRTTSIRVFFNEPVIGVYASTFVVSVAGNAIVGTVVLGSPADRTSYAFIPDVSLPAMSQINVSLSGSITDYANNALTPAPTTFSFETGL